MSVRAKFSTSNELLNMDDIRAGEIRSKLNSMDDLMKQMTCYRIRDDSKLAFLVATGEVPMSMHDVVQEMAFIQWMSENTHYHRLLEITMKLVANRIKVEHDIHNWNTVWKIVREFVPDIVKYHVINQKNGVPCLKKVHWADLED